MVWLTAVPVQASRTASTENAAGGVSDAGVEPSVEVFGVHPPPEPCGGDRVGEWHAPKLINGSFEALPANLGMALGTGEQRLRHAEPERLGDLPQRSA